jgi:hypothetical protein
MSLPHRTSLCPGLLWLTLDLILVIHCLSRNNVFCFNLTYLVKIFLPTLRRLLVPLGLHVPQVEDHCLRLRYEVRY